MFNVLYMYLFYALQFPISVCSSVLYHGTKKRKGKGKLNHEKIFFIHFLLYSIVPFLKCVNAFCIIYYEAKKRGTYNNKVNGDPNTST